MNPETCKGCNICVNVCPTGALVTIKQTDQVVEDLRRRWSLWRRLPDTDDRFVDVASLDEGIGILRRSCSRRTTTVHGRRRRRLHGLRREDGVHLVVAAVNAVMRPRVRRVVKRLDEIVETLDQKARMLLSSDADLDRMVEGGARTVEVALDPGAPARDRADRAVDPRG